MSNTRRFVIGGIICCLLLAMAMSVAMSAPYQIWAETVHYQLAPYATYTPAGAFISANPIGHGQVLIDGNKTIIGEGQGGALLYGDEQIGGTAWLKATPLFVYGFYPPDGYLGAGPPPGWPGNSNYSTKAATMLNGRLYSQDMKMQIHQSTLPTWDGVMTTDDGPWGLGMATGRVESDCTGLVTDGAYLYGSDNPGAMAVGPSYIYKWGVDPAANNGNGALTEVWKVQIPTATWLISIGYYNGKLYAAEGFYGRNIYEIDCATGAYQTILSGANLIPEACGTGAWYMGQIARLGNRMVLVNWTGYITQWQLIAGTWTLQSCNNGLTGSYVSQFYGVSLKAGSDGDAKYAWVSGSNTVYFFDLNPYTGTPANLSAPRKNGYPIYVQAVVTALGPGGMFFVENQERTMGSQVAWTGTALSTSAVGKLVTLKVTSSNNAAGEKVLTAINATDAVSVGAVAPAIKPLYMTNKTMGLATGGAGLANDGLLVTISGKVTGTDMNTEPPTFYIDDGSGVATAIGVKVLKADGTQIVAPYFNDVDGIFVSPNPGNFYAVVTGIVRLEGSGNAVTRRIDARSDADVVITAL